MFKLILKVLGDLSTVFLAIILAVSMFYFVKALKGQQQSVKLFGYEPMSVLTGSMMPYLNPGDMIVVKNEDIDNINIDDIVTYRINSNTLVTHRVVDILNTNGKKMFITKGDANNTADENLILPEQLVGVFAFKIPYGGYVANFIRSSKGFLITIVVPAVLFIVIELISTLSKIDKLGNEEKQKQETS